MLSLALEESLDVRLSAAKLVESTRTIAVIKNDDPDNRLLECASAARADYLITGNTRHFPKAFEAKAIVTPKQFIGLVLPLLAKRHSRKVQE